MRILFFLLRIEVSVDEVLVDEVLVDEVLVDEVKFW
jgi:hypothetical protein